MALAHDLAARLPGSRLRATGDTWALIFEVDGCWLDARVRVAPMIEIYVRTSAIPGFAMRIEARETRIDLPVKRHMVNDGASYYYQVDDAEVAAAIAAARPGLDFEGCYRVLCDQPALQGLWLDLPAVDALTASLWLRRDDGLIGVGAAPTSYDYYVDDGEVLIRRNSELEVDHLARAVVAGGMLAARPHRLARTWLDVARGLGGTTTTDRWELGGAFAATIDRSPATVLVDNVCTLPGEDDDDQHLRTRVRARRVGSHDDRWGLWRPSLARAHRPRLGRGLDRVRELPTPIEEFWHAEATDPGRLRERLRGMTQLFVDASPTVLATSGDEIALWWPDLVMDPGRLGPAVELVSRLAIDLGAATGPYR